MAWRVSCTTVPDLPISVADVRQYLAIDGNDHDALLCGLIRSAVEHCEYETGRVFSPGTYRLELSGWPADVEIRLPYSPIQSVTSIQYYDSKGTLQTWATSNYRINTTGKIGTVAVAADASRPELSSRVDAITITYVAGYPAGALPAGLQTAALALASHWFTNRDAVITGTIATETPLSVARLLQIHSVKGRV